MPCRHRAILIACLCMALVLTACAPKRVLRRPQPPVPTEERRSEPPAPSGSEEEDGQPLPPSRVGDQVTRAIRAATLASEQVGRPYRWGGHSPGRGFDCSGLVMWSYGCVGVELPRVVSEQRRVGRDVHGRTVMPGDLVFFAIDGGRISHVGVVVDDERFVHAPSTGRRVRFDDLDDPYWQPRWVATRRVTGN